MFVTFEDLDKNVIGQVYCAEPHFTVDEYIYFEGKGELKSRRYQIVKITNHVPLVTRMDDHSRVRKTVSVMLVPESNLT